MARYVFYPHADHQQNEIWKDTVEKWGEKQAIAYITGLHAHLQRLTVTPALWRRLPPSLVVPPDLHMQVYCSRFERHYVFFRELPSGTVGVMSILHDRMDLPVRLMDDLARIVDL